MKNQVEALRGYGVKVHMLSSESTMDERQEVSLIPASPLLLILVLCLPAFFRVQIERDLASGHPLARLLYLTPEALFSRHFLKSLKKVVGQQELRRLVVDEAHCISVRSFVPVVDRVDNVD
jgi:superfamily II DNA helicase RecQ